MCLSVRSHNQVERERGYSPSQWAIGRQPTWTEALHDEDPDVVNLSRDGHEAFQQKLLIQQKAIAIAEEELLKTRIARAEKAKHRKSNVFCPGDTVFAWRVGMEKRTRHRKEVREFIRVLGTDLLQFLVQKQPMMTRETKFQEVSSG